MQIDINSQLTQSFYISLVICDFQLNTTFEIISRETTAMGAQYKLHVRKNLFAQVRGSEFRKQGFCYLFKITKIVRQ